MPMTTRFPLHFRIWVIASGAVFAAAMGLQLFFSWTNYGDALLLISIISLPSLHIGLTVWLRRCVLKRKAIKALVSVACYLLTIYGIWMICWTYSLRR